MKYLLYISSILIVCGFTLPAKSESYNVTLDDIITLLDEVYHQIDALKEGNEIQKLRLEILDQKMEKQLLYSEKVDSKVQDIEAKLDRITAVLLKDDNEDHNEQSNQHNVYNSEENIPQLDDRDVVKMLDYRRDNNVAFNGSLLPTQDMQTFKDIESLEMQNETKCSTEPHCPPIEVGQEIMVNTAEEVEPMICLQNADQQLQCASMILPTSCAQSNSLNCLNNKCRIQNRLYGSHSFVVPCDDLTEAGGWIVIQRRVDDSIDFYRNWTEYKQGFGDLDGSYWIGLDKLYALTTTLAPVELLIQLKDYDNVVKYAKYDSFQIGDESTQYVIKDVGAYSGTAGDSFSRHKGNNFSTPDRDNDTMDEFHCASKHKCGWWYHNCFTCNLNGLYLKKGEKPIKGAASGINWWAFHGYDYSMKFVQMLIRPKRI